jgi:ElaB/YqjD/DUF883 family membrane-anchored ribosome-binding protein
MEISKKELQQNLDNVAKTAENHIKELESEMNNASGDVKKQMQTTLDEVKVQQKIIADKTKELAEVSQDGWESIRAEANKTANEASSKIDSLASSVKSYFK